MSAAFNHSLHHFTCSSNIYLHSHRHPLQPYFLLRSDEGHYSGSCTHCSFSPLPAHTSTKAIRSYLSSTELSAHFIKESLGMLLQPLFKWGYRGLFHILELFFQEVTTSLWTWEAQTFTLCLAQADSCLVCSSSQ